MLSKTVCLSILFSLILLESVIQSNSYLEWLTKNPTALDNPTLPTAPSSSEDPLQFLTAPSDLPLESLPPSLSSLPPQSSRLLLWWPGMSPLDAVYQLARLFGTGAFPDGALGLDRPFTQVWPSLLRTISELQQRNGLLNQELGVSNAKLASVRATAAESLGAKEKAVLERDEARVLLAAAVSKQGRGQVEGCNIQQEEEGIDQTWPEEAKQAVRDARLHAKETQTRLHEERQEAARVLAASRSHAASLREILMASNLSSRRALTRLAWESSGGFAADATVRESLQALMGGSLASLDFQDNQEE